MNFKIENVEIYGINKSIISSGNAMRTVIDDNSKQPSDKDLQRAIKLANTETGAGHDNFLNGIVVQFDLYAPLYMWKQIQRYHFLDFISSQSTMHRLTKFKVSECCVEDTDEVILERYQFLLDTYNNFDIRYASMNDVVLKNELKIKKWRKLVASLPCGFVLGATMTTNYRQLKTIYHQRKNHKLDEWKDFCKWIESLPKSELIIGEK